MDTRLIILHGCPTHAGVLLRSEAMAIIHHIAGLPDSEGKKLKSK
jgi:hypothetical protein